MAKGKMTILEHLKELRRRITTVAVILIIFFSVGMYFVDFLLNLALKPISDAQLVFLTPSEAFLANLKLAFTCAGIVSFPIVLFHVLAFTLPAFKKQKKRYIVLFFISIITLFTLGIAFAYYVVSPIAIKFFLGFERPNIQATISISSYISFIANMVFAFGLVFQTPVLFMLLGKMGLVKSTFLRRNWKYAFLGIVIISAVITPPDVFSQMLMVLPLMLLFEMSIILVKVVEKGRKIA